MKRILLLAILLLGTGPWLAHVRAEETTREAMRGKLDNARGVLEGLTLARFDLVTTNALQLQALNYTNTYVLVQNQEYGFRSTNFLRSVDRVLEAAKAGNLERATAAYVEMTRGCIECHRTFRREQFLKGQDGALKAEK